MCKWLIVASRLSAEHLMARVHVLVAPFERGPRRVGVVKDGGRRRLVCFADSHGRNSSVSTTRRYALVVVDEAHHLRGDAAVCEQLRLVDFVEILFLGDASQATAVLDGEGLVRSLSPAAGAVKVVALTEVVRSTKRIVAGAAAFQLAAGRKAETYSRSASVGPPLIALVFPKSDDATNEYARTVAAALEKIKAQLAGVSLDDRVAIVCPDDAFVAALRGPLAEVLGDAFELVDAKTASAVLSREEGDDGAVAGPQRLVIDSIEAMDGLERLAVVCVGLDNVVEKGASTTRSRIYRAMTRSQLVVAVVNEFLPGGWLEFLGHVDLDASKGFDDDVERTRRVEAAADEIVDAEARRGGAGDEEGAVEEKTPVDVAADAAAASVSTEAVTFDRSGDESPAAGVVAEAAHAGDGAPARPAAKVKQSIWDTSAALVPAPTGELAFMPFSTSVVVAPEEFSELAKWEGHSKTVRRRGVP